MYSQKKIKKQKIINNSVSLQRIGFRKRIASNRTRRSSRALLRNDSMLYNIRAVVRRAGP